MDRQQSEEAKYEEVTDMAEYSANEYINTVNHTSDDTGGYLEPVQNIVQKMDLSGLEESYIHPMGILHNRNLPQLKNALHIQQGDYYQPLHGGINIDLNGKSLDKLPDDLLRGNIRDIKVLNMEKNEFMELPADLFKMSSLIYLNAASQMSPKRASISRLPALSNIPEEIDKLRSLSYMILWNNAITALPNTMRNLKNLFHLDLRLNSLAEFPPCICELVSLQELLLSGNYIEVIPRDIQNLQLLSTLRIGNNKLKEVPDEICKLTRLSYLSLRTNCIVQLPRRLSKLKALLPHKASDERLWVDDNPLEYPPKHIASKGITEIFRYLESHRPVTSKTRDCPVVLRITRDTARLPSTVHTVSTVDTVSTVNTVSTVDNVSQEDINQFLKSAVADYGLEFREPTAGDGNCFFHAIADQLQRPGMNLPPYNHDELREQMVMFLKERSDTEICEWIRNTSESEEDYINKMGQDGTWADEVAVCTMAKLLKREIHVVTSSPNQMQSNGQAFMGPIYNSGAKGKQLILGHYHEFHYQSLGLPYDQEFTTETEDPYVRFNDIIVSYKTKCLDLSKQQLENIPESVLKLEDLESLILNNNCLLSNNWVLMAKEIPKLHTLSLRKQKSPKQSSDYKTLQYIPNDIYRCKNLTHLSMSHNRIDTIPVEVTMLKHLEVLDLLNNNIKNIPPEIEHLEKLKYLGLSKNEIKVVPNQIGRLVSLKVLRLSYNKIMELPDSICNLINLIVLSLSDNDLYYLPPQLFQLQGLNSHEKYQCEILDKTVLKAVDRCMEAGNTVVTNVFNYLKEMNDNPPVKAKRLKQAKDKMRLERKENSADSVDRESVSSMGIQYSDLHDEFLLRLAKNIGKEWRQLGTFLKISTPSMDQCQANHPKNSVETTNEMLKMWRDKNYVKGEKSLLKTLFEALGEADRTDLQDKLTEQYQRLQQKRLSKNE